MKGIVFAIGLQRLQAYVERKGHAGAPLHYKDETGFKLGIWVGSRRTEFRKGSLSPECIKALENLPGWVWDPVEEDYKIGLVRLQAYVERKGHARAPIGYKDEGGFKLGNWVSNRRTEFREGDLSPERIKALEALPGWVWDPVEEGFLIGLQRLQAYVEREGHASVPQRYKDETGFKLGSWVANRRTNFRKGDLSPERIKALEDVPGWVWNQFEEGFKIGLQRLQAYVEREGHAKVPHIYKDETGFKLGSWISSRRTEFRKGSLSPECIKALEALPGWVWWGAARSIRGQTKTP